MNTRVNFDIANLIKEKGFDEPCDSWYYNDGSYHDNPTKWINSELGETNCSRPTLADVVKWLYDKHGIWINVSITIQKEYYYQCLDITGKKDPTKNNYPSRMCKPGNYFNSPTEAYEAAIEYCLTNLI